MSHLAGWNGDNTAVEVFADGRRSNISDMLRIRGDISLYACIGGAGCGDALVGDLPEFKSAGANRIGGVMENLEHAPAPGVRTDRSSGRYLEARRAIRGKPFPGSADGSNPTDAEADDVAAETLAGAAITDGGAFKGAVIPDGRDHAFGEGDAEKDRMSRQWGAGEFEGALYGPGNGMEVAGAWYAPASADMDTIQPGMLGTVGGFGAVCGNCD